MQKTSKEIIIQHLGFSELQYGQLVYDFGLEWLNRYFFANNIMISALENSHSFWIWWKRQWELRDERFINAVPLNELNLNEPSTKSFVMQLYYDEHNVYKLKTFPDKVVRLEAGREIIKIHQSINQLKNESR